MINPSADKEGGRRGREAWAAKRKEREGETGGAREKGHKETLKKKGAAHGKNGMSKVSETQKRRERGRTGPAKDDKCILRRGTQRDRSSPQGKAAV